MSETTSWCCPECGTEIRERPAESRQFDCPHCARQFRVLVDKTDGWIGMVPLKAMTTQEPLGLPQGSIRAIATLVTAGCSWGLLIGGTTVPDYVLDLLLAIIGYYFGFRRKDRGSGSRILDASSKAQEPLGLPGGTIRMMLIAGFAISAWVLYSRGQVGSPEHMEFFLILAALIAGYFFSRLFAGLTGGRLGNLINHAKGLIVVIATVRLAVLLMGGPHSENPQLGLALACIISFYFGSRS